ncbi:MAG: CpsD/CapB family tyrosine-protein kinase [Clostridia bacterium]|nr:CpsD/CapB family tyrosine-protein kinase [Clostridia bacterium]
MSRKDNSIYEQVNNPNEPAKAPKRQRSKPLLLNEMSPFAVKEAYKAVRANINFAIGAKTGCKIFLFTSSVPAEGKTTTAVNLAIAFGQTNAKVLLIDADMRKSSIHRYLGIKNTLGLSNVLSGYTQLNEIIKKTPHGFDCMTAGPTPPNPAELLLAQPCDDLLNTLSQFYDYIIIDTPPVAVVSDCLALVEKVDGVVIAIREYYSVHEQLEKAISALKFADAKILGFILNDSKGNGRTYKYRYRYSYRYNYKKGYSGYDYYDNYGDYN